MSVKDDDEKNWSPKAKRPLKHLALPLSIEGIIMAFIGEARFMGDIPNRYFAQVACANYPSWDQMRDIGTHYRFRLWFREFGRRAQYWKGCPMILIQWVEDPDHSFMVVSVDDQVSWKQFKSLTARQHPKMDRLLEESFPYGDVQGKRWVLRPRPITQ